MQKETGQIISSGNNQDEESVGNTVGKGAEHLFDDFLNNQKRQMEQEDEELEDNIQQVSKIDDVSPRQTNSLKIGAKNDRFVIPL